MLRESCLHCMFRTKERFSDIVIGDFWGIEKINPELSDRKGVSVLITSSKKGEEFVGKLTGVTMIETDPEITPNVLKGYLPTQTDATVEIERAKWFANEYKAHSFIKMSELYPTISFMDRVIASIKFRLKLK